jgi:fructokinase
VEVLCAGELLVDFIGNEEAPLASTRTFTRFRGGSTANLAANLAGLGVSTSLAASVGDDRLGDFAVADLEERGVDVTRVARRPEPTSVAIVSRSAHTAQFVLHRAADGLLDEGQLELADETRIFHTTAFALSGPSQGLLLDAARRARNAGLTPTLDANWAPGVGATRTEVRRALIAYCELQPLLKASADDVQRILGETSVRDAVAQLHEWGAREIVVTLGSDGSLVSQDGDVESVPPESVDVVDATGAGDAYWAGFLWRWLRGDDLVDCASTGTRLAVTKLGQVGPLSGEQLRQFVMEYRS